MVHNGQAVVEGNYEELFQKLDELTGALSTMQSTLLALQNKAWVADAKEVSHSLKPGSLSIVSVGRSWDIN